MKILLDTSVIVAGLVEAHPMHRRALPWLAKAKAGDFSFFVCSHSFAEVFAVLTSLPVRPPIRPELARRLIEDNLESKAQCVELTCSDYSIVTTAAVKNGINGGGIYDSLIACAAQKSGVNKLLTFNTGDFLRVWPKGEGIILSP